MPRDERAFDAGLSDPAIPPALATGRLRLLGLLPGSSNYTFLVAADDPGGGDELLAVYKPRRGERPLWDFPDGTLCLREVAAFVVARALGWPRVPPTVLRDGPHGLGATQVFVDADPEQHYFTLQRAHVDVFRDLALFDVVANNADRKAGHCLLAADGGIVAIDHGLCFHEEDKLRTVIWEFTDEPIPRDRLNDLRALSDAACRGDGPLRRSLNELLAPEEIDAMTGRIEGLLRSGRFPGPGDERPYPWPPI